MSKPLQHRRIARLLHQANEQDRTAIMQSKQLLSDLNECNVLGFCKLHTLGTIELGTLLQCHTLTTHLDKSSYFFTQFTKKIRVTLKKYADTIVTTRPLFLELTKELGPDGSIRQLYTLLGSRLAGNGTEAYNYLYTQMQPKIKKLQKRFVESVAPTETVANGFIYMIRTRASRNVNENVFKIGKTSRAFNNRMNGYDKGYETILVVPVPYAILDDTEQRILEHIGQHFKQRADYGHEYFEGDRMELVNRVMKLCFS